MSDYKNYLPSKKFQAIVLIIVVFIALFFTVKGIVSLIKSKKLTSKEPAKITVSEIIQKDSNNNGIPDFEEYLWGLDPNKNGPENKEFILAKKKTLAESNDSLSTDPSQAVTDNDLLSQEFFATIVSLQQTGSLNDESLGAITSAIGDNVKAVEIKDIYTYNMMTVVGDGTLANNTYQEDLSKLVTKYQDADIGNELTFIIQGLNNKDPQALYAAQTVAIAYQNFGKEFIKVPVPKALASLQLSAANNYEKTGQTIHDLTTMLNDPLGGMKGILNYKNYNDALGTDLEKISEILQ